MSAATAEERLNRYDQEVDELKTALVTAFEQLTAQPAVDATFAERLHALAGRLDGLRQRLRPEDFDKDQAFNLLSAVSEILYLVNTAGDRPDLNICDRLLIAIEQMRHVIRDALDEHVVGVASDRGVVLDELRAWLPTTSLATIADLVDVDRRTLNRWQHAPGPPSHRLALVARLVAILRHAWTEPGIVAWFDRPRRDLDGRRPRSLLADPGAEEALIAAARAGRSQYAS